MTVSSRPPRPARRTQAEKSADTRLRVLEAAIETLAERGYANMTTNDVLERGGLSRGGMLHHFPSKATLVAAAIDHLFDVRIAQFRSAVLSLPRDADAVPAALEIAWRDFTSPAWGAVLELLVAARSDRELLEQVRSRLATYEETIRQTAHELFGHRWSALEIEAGTRLVYHLLNGLALTHPLRRTDDEARFVFALLSHGYAEYAARVPPPAPKRKRTTTKVPVKRRSA
jgi:AcrR family transcriptional regulator